MWIRSQNGRQLVKVNWLEMLQNSVGWAIFGGYDRESILHFRLGDYATEEKAYSVLNQVERNINMNYNKVFEMPADDEGGSYV